MNKIEDDTIVKVIKNVHKMLENRGHDVTQINKTEPLKFVLKKIEHFRSNNNTVLDIFINSERKVYVKFINIMKNNNSSQELVKLYKFIYDSNRFTNNDDIIFVVFDKLGEEVYNIEEKYSNVTLFDYKKFLINIVEHMYVPKHVKIHKDEHNSLKTKLMIKDLDQLPLLSKSDAISRYYNYRIGDVIRVERPSNGNMKHIIYRYVVQL